MPKAGHQRPHDLDGGPHALHQLIGSNVRLHGGGIHGHRAVDELHDRSQVLQDLLHGAHVLDIGDVMEHTGARREKRRGHELESGVLRPRDDHLPTKPAAATHNKPRTCSPRSDIRRHFSGTPATLRRLRARRSASCSR